MLKKIGKLNLPLSSKRKNPIKADIQFSTQDSNSAELRFNFYQNEEHMAQQLNASGEIFLLMEDGSSFLDSLNIGKTPLFEANYVLTDDQLSHKGEVKAEIYLYDIYGNKTSVHKFTFKIDEALVDQNIEPIAEYYVKNFNDLKAMIQTEADGLQEAITSLEDKFEDLDNIETKQGAQAKVNIAFAEAEILTTQLRNEFETHEESTDNPHNVTKSQVGLSNVTNEAQATKAEFDSHSTNDAIHVTIAKKSEWDAKETVSGSQAKADTAESNAVNMVTEFEWVNATLTNSFTDIDVNTPLQFGITSLGEVYVRGVVTGGALGDSICTLPTEAQPDREVVKVCAASNTTADTYTLVAGIDGSLTPIATTKDTGETDYLSVDFSFMK